MQYIVYDIQDGCGAVVVLMVADCAIVASLGKCRAFVAQAALPRCMCLAMNIINMNK